MTEVYLFDWGDTLMVDYANTPGKMCEWDDVAAVDGAKETLQYLAKKSAIYIATGAANSSAADIEKAFHRVALSEYISGYFCKEKGSVEFLNAVINKLNVSAKQVTMVGDNFKKDIEPAIAIGIQAIWLANASNQPLSSNIKVIHSLRELCR